MCVCFVGIKGRSPLTFSSIVSTWCLYVIELCRYGVCALFAFRGWLTFFSFLDPCLFEGVQNYNMGNDPFYNALVNMQNIFRTSLFFAKECFEVFQYHYAG